jgi:hypothetical protein
MACPRKAWSRSILPKKGQIHALARTIDICMIFRDPILMDASEMNEIFGLVIIYQLESCFAQASEFSTFSFDAICFLDLLSRILINGFIDFWIFILSIFLQNSRSKFMSNELDAIVVSI